MRVFVTGGTGLVGALVVAELIGHGHTVLALTRSNASARAAEAAGAEPVQGGLADLDVLRSAAADADGVIHLAFSNDFSSAEALAKGVAEESAALDVLGEALIGSGRPLVVTAGTPFTPGRPSTEADHASIQGPVGGRGLAVAAVLGLASRGVRSAAVRLPRTVHNNGSGGFAGMLTGIARKTGVAGYPGDGEQRWPAVHALDAAVLFRLVLEQAQPGTVWHAIADEGDKVRDIMAVVGRRLGLPVTAVPGETFGPLSQIFLADQPSSGVHTQQTLRWTPSHPSLLQDLESLQP